MVVKASVTASEDLARSAFTTNSEIANLSRRFGIPNNPKVEAIFLSHNWKLIGHGFDPTFLPILLMIINSSEVTWNAVSLTCLTKDHSEPLIKFQYFGLLLAKNKFKVLPPLNILPPKASEPVRDIA